MNINKPTQLRMSESDKQQTFQAAIAAINFINQRRDELNKYKIEVLTYAVNNAGNHSFTFNMDFMKVRFKLVSGYVRNGYANSRLRERQVSAESLKIANGTGASFREVRELFLLLMNGYIHF